MGVQRRTTHRLPTKDCSGNPLDFPKALYPERLIGDASVLDRPAHRSNFQPAFTRVSEITYG